MTVSWDYEIPNIWKNKNCSKPPTRCTSFSIGTSTALEQVPVPEMPAIDQAQRLVLKPTVSMMLTTSVGNMIEHVPIFVGD